MFTARYELNPLIVIHVNRSLESVYEAGCYDIDWYVTMANDYL